MVRSLSPFLRPIAVLVALTALQQVSFAQEGIEVRAAKVCAGIAKEGGTFQGTFKVDDLTVSGNANGTVTVSKDGVNLGGFVKGTYAEFSSCLIKVIELISPRTEQTPVPLKQAHFEIVDGYVFGGMMVSMANPTSEDISVYGVTFQFPAQSVKILRARR